MSRLTQVSAMLAASIVFAPVAPAQDKPAQKLIPREAMRYDGKTFEEWRDYPRTELKAERRIEAMRAMGAFGANGYATEAAEVIVAVIRSYPEKGFWLEASRNRDEQSSFRATEKKELTPDEKVYAEAFAALAKIGGPCVPVLLGQADHPNSYILADALLTHEEGIVVRPTDIPALVTMALSKKKRERDLAIAALEFQTYHAKLGETVAKDLSKQDKEFKIIHVMFDVLRSNSFKPNAHRDPMWLTENFLEAVAPHNPKFNEFLIAELRESRRAAQKEIKEEKFFEPGGFPMMGARRILVPSGAQALVIVNVLGKLGPAARSALPELRAAVEDPQYQLSEAAKTAIDQITAKQP